MDEYLMNLMDRSDQERFLGSIAKPLNEEKSARHSQLSPAEWALIKFFEVIRAKEAAA
jgi:hypothetical protein